MKKLNKYGFNTNNKTYVIAEIGINHGGNFETARRLIDSAAKTKCDAVKFQTYLTEKRAPKGNQEIYDILSKCELPFSDFEKLKSHADSYGLDFFSTPFDTESIECLESIGTEIYKIASFDVVNKSLLRDLSKTGKSIIMSVGMANFQEIMEAYDILITKVKGLAILHCVSAYPTNEENANLSVISELMSKFSNCIVGQSDHTQGIKVPLYAVAAGAQIIEKHYKIDDDMICVDAPVSISEKRMKNLVSEIRSLEKIMGDSELQLTKPEEDSLIFRRQTK